MATKQHFRHKTREFNRRLQRNDVKGVPRSSVHSALFLKYSTSVVRIASDVYVLPRCYAACVYVLQENGNTKIIVILRDQEHYTFVTLRKK
jgi:hypothetical protein